jgi:hypothetical protein
MSITDVVGSGTLPQQPRIKVDSDHKCQSPLFNRCMWDSPERCRQCTENGTLIIDDLNTLPLYISVLTRRRGSALGVRRGSTFRGGLQNRTNDDRKPAMRGHTHRNSCQRTDRSREDERVGEGHDHSAHAACQPLEHNTAKQSPGLKMRHVGPCSMFGYFLYPPGSKS